MCHTNWPGGTIGRLCCRKSDSGTQATHKLLICTRFTLLIAQVVWLAACMINLCVRFFCFFNLVYPHQNHWHPSCWEEGSAADSHGEESRGWEDSECCGDVSEVHGERRFVMHRVAPHGSQSTESGRDTDWQFLIGLLTLQPPHPECWADILTSLWAATRRGGVEYFFTLIEHLSIGNTQVEKNNHLLLEKVNVR